MNKDEKKKNRQKWTVIRMIVTPRALQFVHIVHNVHNVRLVHSFQRAHTIHTKEWFT